MWAVANRVAVSFPGQVCAAKFVFLWGKDPGGQLGWMAGAGAELGQSAAPLMSLQAIDECHNFFLTILIFH